MTLPLLVVLTLAAAACGSSLPTGVVRGTAEGVGGPPMYGIGTVRPPMPEVGATITLHGPSGLSLSVQTGKGGAFSVDAPAGRYTVTGRSDGNVVFDDCAASNPIQVIAGTTTTVTVTCNIP